MANVSANTTMWNSPNYLGQLYVIGETQTPFLSIIGGLKGDIRVVDSLEFPMAVTVSQEAASQPAISETSSGTVPSTTTFVRGQDKNTCQIFQYGVNVSYLKMSTSGVITGDSTTHQSEANEPQPVPNELDEQITRNMEQGALDAEYTFLNGSYQQATDAGTAAKCRGIITACSSNAVAASAADLDKSIMDELLRTMVGNGAKFRNTVLFCNAFQRQKLSEIYGFVPADRNIGGVDISTIYTEFAVMGVIYAPLVPSDTILLADVSVCKPVGLPVPDEDNGGYKGVLFYEELAKTGAAAKGQIYGQLGLDYGPEEYHGKITGLATS